MPVRVLINPGAGAAAASKALIDSAVSLLYTHLGHEIDVQTSLSAEHLGDLAGEFVGENVKTSTDLTLVACGGDGTVHEIVNALVRPVVDNPAFNPPTIRIVVVPVGTANALYYSLFADSPTKYSLPEGATVSVSDDDLLKLQSVLAFIQGGTQQLAVSRTRLLSAAGGLAGSIVSFVVTSTSLHASILDTAEQLRKDVPRLDRFQLAARQNISKWYHARAVLHPGAARYDPESDAFVSLSESDGEDLPGPFTYFVSTLNVDRLEPAFRVTPLHRSHPPRAGEMDLILMRPRRNPVCLPEGGPARAASAQTSAQVLRAAYDNGRHVRLRFDAEGGVTEGGDGPLVAEYFRCTGWDWIPEESDEDAHLVCADGTIMSVPAGGKAVCTMLSQFTFLVCA
ncbi:hypothetical protein EXIGLDRAFT_733967 [Exidia glandulosa HHB12029]|uniref:DAGKc domain-containing protein n=1 Tax=Exidia glandulosa HHB12029 TaxID=1314781 RepID=A0A165B6L4_EXIGL|nr:hypothetical protein EXIGLDRAFT_733967 [Exidia glandulosa HHB12029]